MHISVLIGVVLLMGFVLLVELSLELIDSIEPLNNVEKIVHLLIINKEAIGDLRIITGL